MAQTADPEGERLRTSFGARAETYDAVRPHWPPSTVQWLLGSPAPGATLTVADLGCGTGKGSRVIASLGHRVYAVDSSEAMLAQLEAARSNLDAGVAERMASMRAPAESVPLPDASLDAVTAFQAWHWFDKDAAAAECARLLRPGATLGLAWHHRDEDLPWSRELSRIVERTPAPHDESNAEKPPEVPQFATAEHERFGYTMRQSVDDLVRHASTWSYVAVSPRRDEMLARVRALAASVADADGMVQIPMTTYCHRLRRR